MLKRAGGKCEVCDKKEYVNTHHVVGRRNLMLRWDVRNGVALCPLHHVFGKESAHQNPVWFQDVWMIDHRDDDLAWITTYCNTIKKWTEEEMIVQLDRLRGYK